MKIFKGQRKYRTYRLYRANFKKVDSNTYFKGIFYGDDSGYFNYIEHPSIWQRLSACNTEYNIIYENCKKISKVKKLNRGK